jgi:uncharacterized protein
VIKIDSHVHIGDGYRMQLSADVLLKLMDEAEIQKAIVCPMDKCIAVENRQGNDYVMQAVKSHPDRLQGMAVANPWFGKLAIDELRRAFEAGLSGLKIHSVLQGFRLSEHLVDPLLQIAAEFDVPVYAHTGTAGLAEPFHLVELARRFPTINFIMGHGGSSDYYGDSIRSMEFVNNLWLDSSRNGPGNYDIWKKSGLTNRLVFSSNAPDYIPSVEIENLTDIFTTVDEQEMIFNKTIQSIFKGRLLL